MTLINVFIFRLLEHSPTLLNKNYRKCVMTLINVFIFKLLENSPTPFFYLNKFKSYTKAWKTNFKPILIE